MNNHIKTLANGDFVVCSLEEAEEFSNKRNYQYCHCHTCRPISFSDPSSMFMRLCPNCGNKRCPKATNHINECTNSNEPNQKGSIYGGL